MFFKSNVGIIEFLVKEKEAQLEYL